MLDHFGLQLLPTTTNYYQLLPTTTMSRVVVTVPRIVARLSTHPISTVPARRFYAAG